jgi:hypothetical protein
MQPGYEHFGVPVHTLVKVVGDGTCQQPSVIFVPPAIRDKRRGSALAALVVPTDSHRIIASQALFFWFRLTGFEPATT